MLDCGRNETSRGFLVWGAGEDVGDLIMQALVHSTGPGMVGCSPLSGSDYPDATQTPRRPPPPYPEDVVQGAELAGLRSRPAPARYPPFRTQAANRERHIPDDRIVSFCQVRAAKERPICQRTCFPPALSGVPETMLWSLHERASAAKRSDGILHDAECVRIYNS